MKKVLILYTGGTIGMDYSKDGLAIVKNLFESKLNTLPAIKNVNLTVIEYDELIDSSDITIYHWQKIIQDIANNYYSYDGFVVIHGTDTMAYTASVLAFSLKNLGKAVILTGAQLPLTNRRSDGWNNITNAIYAAIEDNLHEVAICFNNKLYRGCRAQKVSTNNFWGFDSVDEEPLADFGIDITWYKKRWLIANNLEFLPIIPKDTIKVLDLTLRPGFTTDFIVNTLQNITAQAIILQTYGSGTIPKSNLALIDALTKAVKKGIIIVSVTQVIEGRVDNHYANSRLSDIGIISGCDMTVEAALAKLLILFSYSTDVNFIKNNIGRSLVGELTQSYDNGASSRNRTYDLRINSPSL